MLKGGFVFCTLFVFLLIHRTVKSGVCIYNFRLFGEVCMFRVEADDVLGRFARDCV